MAHPPNVVSLPLHSVASVWRTSENSVKAKFAEFGKSEVRRTLLPGTWVNKHRSLSHSDRPPCGTLVPKSCGQKGVKDGTKALAGLRCRLVGVVCRNGRHWDPAVSGLQLR